MKKMILFDFDGVLVHTHIMCYEIHKELNPDLEYGFFQSLSHGNFFELYTKAEKEKKIISNPHFHDKYQKGVAGLETPPELKKVIVDLSKKYQLTIVSSTLSDWIRPFLEKEKLLDKFHLILGRDVEASKVKKINDLFLEHDLSPQDVVFVTDTTGDIMEAREAGVASIAVTWGLHDKKNLADEEPYAVVDTPQELKEKIEEYFR